MFIDNIDNHSFIQLHMHLFKVYYSTLSLFKFYYNIKN